MLATVSPSSKSYVETMNTLKYAERLKRANAHLNKDPDGPRLTKVRETPTADGRPVQKAVVLNACGSTPSPDTWLKEKDRHLWTNESISSEQWRRL